MSTGTSNLVAVAAEDGSVPERAGRLMASIVYLPSYPQLGAAGRDRLIAGLRAAAGAGPRLNHRAFPDLARPVAPARADRLTPVPQRVISNLVAEFAADPYVPLIGTIPTPYTPAEGLAYLDRQHQRLADGTGWSFAIAELATDRAVGGAGLWLHRRRLRHRGGYAVAASARGRGIATAALTALTELRLDPARPGPGRAVHRAGQPGVDRGGRALRLPPPRADRRAHRDRRNPPGHAALVGDPAADAG